MPKPAKSMPETPASSRLVMRTLDGHRLSVRTMGNPQGVPVVVLHGGPGSGCSPAMADWVDLRQVRLVLPDQRGAGLSRPRGCTRRNGVPHLIADLERIRRALNIASWVVVGGSWGATLALAYAARCPGAVRALVLRGTFTASQADLRYFFAPRRRLKSRHSVARRSAVRAPVTRVLHNWAHAFQFDTPTVAHRLAAAWQARERALLEMPSPMTGPRRLRPAACCKYRIQAHLLARLGGLGPRGILALAAALRRWEGLAMAIHGMRDRVCPPAGLRRLQACWPALQVTWVEAGHTVAGPAMRDALRHAIEAAVSAPRRAQASVLPCS
ncbi:MAG: alpha/beta fold hydrolase [Pandoraea sp.]|nr:MAG: alpha/beta fold hydrolase [Pandoraea sp.]TAM17328.1 MAG: alpha/beta fold hydrolase [Pandoraea sp.]